MAAETEQTEQVAVWLMDGDREDIEDEVRLLRVVAHIAGGDFEFAYRVADGTDEKSARPWEAVIAGPVSYAAAEVIVRWVHAEGGHAIIDEGYYDDDSERSGMSKTSFVPVGSRMTLSEHVDDILGEARAELLRRIEADDEGHLSLLLWLRGDLTPGYNIDWGAGPA
jgi:hypothetical protein